MGNLDTVCGECQGDRDAQAYEETVPEPKNPDKLPKATDPALVGKYSQHCCTGGGAFWDEVLEYRVWYHPHREEPQGHGDDVMHTFATYGEAKAFSDAHRAAEPPLVLVMQREMVTLTNGLVEHWIGIRYAEWQPVWLEENNQGSKANIPAFMDIQEAEGKLIDRNPRRVDYEKEYGPILVEE